MQRCSTAVVRADWVGAVELSDMAHDGSDTPKRPGPVRGGLIARTPKWLLLAGFWLVQAAVLYHLQAFLYLSQGDVQASEQVFLGVIPEFAQFVGLAYGDPEFIVPMLVTVVLLTAAQGLLLLPARRPGFAMGRGKSVRGSDIYVRVECASE